MADQNTSDVSNGVDETSAEPQVKSLPADEPGAVAYDDDDQKADGVVDSNPDVVQDAELNNATVDESAEETSQTCNDLPAAEADAHCPADDVKPADADAAEGEQDQNEVEEVQAEESSESNSSPPTQEEPEDVKLPDVVQAESQPDNESSPATTVEEEQEQEAEVERESSPVPEAVPQSESTEVASEEQAGEASQVETTPPEQKDAGSVQAKSTPEEAPTTDEANKFLEAPKSAAEEGTKVTEEASKVTEEAPKVIVEAPKVPEEVPEEVVGMQAPQYEDRPIPNTESAKEDSAAAAKTEAAQGLAVDFTGKWKSYKVENFEDYLKVVGMNFFLRKIASRASPMCEMTQVGNHFHVKLTTGFFNQEVDFNVGEEYESGTPFGDTMLNISHWEGEKLVTESKPKDENSKVPPVSLVREFIDGELVMTMTAKDAVATRHFKKLE